MGHTADANGALHSTTDGKFTGHLLSESDVDQVALGSEGIDPLSRQLLDYADQSFWEQRVGSFDYDRCTEDILGVGSALPGTLRGDTFVVAENGSGNSLTGIDVMVPVTSDGRTYFLTDSIDLAQFEPEEEKEPGLPTAAHYLGVLTAAHQRLLAARDDLSGPKAPAGPSLDADDLRVLEEMFGSAQSGWDSFDESNADFGDYSEEDLENEQASRERQEALMRKLGLLLD